MLTPSLVATPFLPFRIEEEMAEAAAYYQLKERCLYCDMLKEELAFGERVVAANQ